VPRNQGCEPLDHVLVKRGAGINAIGTHLVEQGLGEMVQRIDRLRSFRGCGSGDDVHVRLFHGFCRMLMLNLAR
jgi:hypothetical protein